MFKFTMLVSSKTSKTIEFFVVAADAAKNIAARRDFRLIVPLLSFCDAPQSVLQSTDTHTFTTENFHAIN